MHRPRHIGFTNGHFLCTASQILLQENADIDRFVIMSTIVLRDGATQEMYQLQGTHKVVEMILR